jgi:hypothetical protein
MPKVILHQAAHQASEELMMWRVGKVIGVLLLGILVMGITVWGVLAITYSDIDNPVIRHALAWLFGLATLGAFGLLRRRRRTLVGFVMVWLILVVWWWMIEPSNERDWQPNVAVLPSVTVAGNRVTVHNIRNFDYRTETDFTPRYYDKTFDLKQLNSVDLISSFWGSEAIAHLFLSFGFGGRDYVAVSVETRKERTEGYSTLTGFFKQYELIYIVGDERDLIRVRTNYRQQPPEDVYLYRLHLPQAQIRRLFLDYVRTINALTQHPEFYNTLTTNCATNILIHAEAAGGRVRYNWKILLSGHTPEYVYEIGRFGTRLPFTELRRQSHINARAQAADTAADFSQKIRVGLPTMTSKSHQ